ncbi:MAG: hypothetical protein JWN76_2048 [Chitinophagaceae bacterium]|nr:hypothetical protein [Chitinophagaceae bacterium]
MKKLLLFVFAFIIYTSVFSQDNYEIQVYGSETMTKHYTMLELHSNYTFSGTKQKINGVFPSNHIWHETIEITHGFSDWFETGFYIFTSVGSNNRTNYVGSHIRPRVAIPQRYHFPVGLSLSAEIGYQKREYSEDDWSIEIRPIIDKDFGKLYLSFNPTFEKSLHGLNQKEGFEFAPNFKAALSLSKWIIPGIEYYGSLGVLNHLAPYQQQEHALFITLDSEFSPDWEFNIGYGFGLTNATDHSIIKLILGRRIHGKTKRSKG